MKALHLLILLPLSILCLKSTAQVEDLMRNKNITWIAESYNDFVTEGIMEDKIGKQMNQVTPLKFLNTNEDIVPESFILQRFLIEAIEAQKLPIYADADCKILTNYSNLYHTETDTINDSTTFEIKIKVSHTVPSAEQVSFFRARQILYYDSIKVQFGLRTVSIAAMAKQYDKKNNFIGWTPFFWIKATDLMSKRPLSDESITWASRLILNKGFALKSDSTKILKQTSDNEPIVSLFEAFTTKPNIPFYKINGIESNEQYTFPERRSLFSGVDTICMIHTITYETKLKTRARSVNAKAIENLILIQNWYWDDVKKEVQIWLRATAPLIEYKDNDSERQYSGNFDKPSFFYRRTDD